MRVRHISIARRYTYTRFVLDCGAAGDLLDLYAALAPRVLGYAEIGPQLAARAAPGNPSL